MVIELKHANVTLEGKGLGQAYDYALAIRAAQGHRRLHAIQLCRYPVRSPGFPWFDHATLPSDKPRSHDRVHQVHCPLLRRFQPEVSAIQPVFGRHGVQCVGLGPPVTLSCANFFDKVASA